MKKTKKIISLLLLISLTCSCFSFLSFAAAEGGIIYSEKVNATAGDNVSIPVYISDNAGLMGYKIKLTYDKTALTPVSVSQGTAITGGMFNDTIGSPKYANDNFIFVVWSGSENNNGNGVLFTVNFAVDENADGNCNIEIDYEQSDTFNEAWEDVVLKTEDTTISITNPSLNDFTRFYITDAECNSDETITFPIKICNVNDLQSAVLVLSYDDEAFTLLGENIIEQGKAIINLSDLSNHSDDDTVALLTLKVGKFVDGDFNFILDSNTENVICNGCTIKVKNKFADENSVVTSSNNFGCVGQTIEVPFTITNNKGILGYRINVTYDDTVLEFIGAESRLPGNFDTQIKDSSFDALWNNSSDIITDGTLFVARFKIIAEGRTTITVSYEQADTFNESWDDVSLDCRSFYLDCVAEILYGDVNRDGFCNGEDAVIVMCIVEGLLTNDNTDTYTMLSADYNRDGQINEIDVFLLEDAGLCLTSID